MVRLRGPRPRSAVIIILTYPQWARTVRVRLTIPDDQTLWAGLMYEYGWRKAKWEEWRHTRKERHR